MSQNQPRSSHEAFVHPYNLKMCFQVHSWLQTDLSGCDSSNLSMWVSSEHIFGGRVKSVTEESASVPSRLVTRWQKKGFSKQKLKFFFWSVQNSLWKPWNPGSRYRTKQNSLPSTAGLCGRVKSTAGWAPWPLPSLISTLSKVPWNRNKWTVFPEDSICIFTGIWFLFLMPYREF